MISGSLARASAAEGATFLDSFLALPKNVINQESQTNRQGSVAFVGMKTATTANSEKRIGPAFTLRAPKRDAQPSRARRVNKTVPQIGISPTSQRQRFTSDPKCARDRSCGGK